MEYRKFADTYVIRLDKGEEIISSLQAICEKENIRLGSVEGIGAAIMRSSACMMWRTASTIKKS